MALYVYPYKMGSKSAKTLADALGAKRVYPDGNFKMKPGRWVVNWGSSTQPTWEVDLGVFNVPAAVKVATNKKSALQRLSLYEIPTVEFTADKEQAAEWIQQGHTVVSRKILSGSQGKGIVLSRTLEELEGAEAPLYTKYFKKKYEYRIHVADGYVFYIQQKKRRNGFEEVNNQIRNYHKGWVFCHNDIIPPPSDVKDISEAAVSALGLHFGAVDVAWNEHYQEARVLEVNTAPALEGTTLARYVTLFKEIEE